MILDSMKWFKRTFTGTPHILWEKHGETSLFPVKILPLKLKTMQSQGQVRFI
jgi:hypothetical protein